jgi:hypothetical protein
MRGISWSISNKENFMDAGSPGSPTPAKPPSTAGYAIGKAEEKCALCGSELATGQKLMAALRETPAALERLDICLNCWEKFDRKDLLGFWQATKRPPAERERKNLFVDDDVLCELFQRLAEAQEPAKVNFRFVLGLILMRRRRIVYESTRREGAGEVWSVRFKGREELMDLLNPRLDEEKVGEVSLQLGEILSGEL